MTSFQMWGYTSDCFSCWRSKIWQRTQGGASQLPVQNRNKTISLKVAVLDESVCNHFCKMCLKRRSLFWADWWGSGAPPVCSVFVFLFLSAHTSYLCSPLTSTSLGSCGPCWVWFCLGFPSNKKQAFPPTCSQVLAHQGGLSDVYKRQVLLWLLLSLKSHEMNSNL